MATCLAFWSQIYLISYYKLNFHSISSYHTPLLLIYLLIYFLITVVLILGLSSCTTFIFTWQDREKLRGRNLPADLFHCTRSLPTAGGNQGLTRGPFHLVMCAFNQVYQSSLLTVSLELILSRYYTDSPLWNLIPFYLWQKTWTPSSRSVFILLVGSPSSMLLHFKSPASVRWFRQALPWGQHSICFGMHSHFPQS